jgi:hypothetical protein
VAHATITTLMLSIAGIASAVFAGPGADFNGDGFDDLVVGVPHEDRMAIDEEVYIHMGAVHVIYGSASGLTADGDQRWHQDREGIQEQREMGEAFGRVVAWGDFDGDGFDDLVVGVALESLNGFDGAGAVHVIYGSASGLRSQGSEFWTQDSPGIAGEVHEGAYFGIGVAAGDFNGDALDDLAITRASLPATDDAIQLLYGSASGLVAGNAIDIEAYENSVAGDFNGDGIEDLAVAAAYATVDGVMSAGMVSILYGTDSGLTSAGSQTFSQNTEGMPNEAEEFDHFGGAIAAGDFNGDGFSDLANSAPHETSGALPQ